MSAEEHFEEYCEIHGISSKQYKDEIWPVFEYGFTAAQVCYGKLLGNNNE
jgi:hypothetical protein